MGKPHCFPFSDSFLRKIFLRLRKFMSLTEGDKNYMVDKCWTVVCEVIMQTEEKLFKYQEQMKKASRPERFSVYAFVFNSLYYLFYGMLGWFMLYFFGGTSLIFAVFAFTRSLWVVFAVLLLLRLVNALTAERLKQKHMKSFIDRNQNVNYSKPVLFYFLPIRRLAMCAVFSCGLFEFYWMYKNWKAIRRDTRDEEIRPLLRGWLFGFFFIWPLLSVIRLNLGRSKTKGRKFVYHAAGYGSCLLIQLLCGLLLYGTFFSHFTLVLFWCMYMVAWICGIVLLAAIQKRINFHNQKSNHKLSMPGWQKAEIGITLAGLILNLVVLTVRLPEEGKFPELELALGSTYRMTEGYVSFCRKQGYEMAQWPQVYAQYFRSELKIVDEALKPYRLTIRQAWDVFNIPSEKTVEDSIMNEFTALKPVIIEQIIKQHKASNSIYFDEKAAREFLEKEITLPVLCSETDKNAHLILNNNETYKNAFRKIVRKIKDQLPQN